MKGTAVVALSALLLLGICRPASAQGIPQKGAYVCELAFNFQPPKEGITYLSLVQLVANPEKYDGRLVCVAGYFDLEYEAATLYLHEEDAHNGLDENGIWLDVHGIKGDQIRPMNNKYVWMLGRFRAGPLFGPPAMAPGPPSNINVVGGLTRILEIAEVRSGAQPASPNIWIRPGYGRK